MSDSWHDRLYAVVPYAGALLLAAAGGLWMLLGDADRAAPAAVGAAPARYSDSALSLVVVEADWCGWCKRFRRDVAPAYDNSAYAGRVPLRYVALERQAQSGIRFSASVRAVPTFLLVDADGREVARLRGYPGGPDRFFAALDGMLDKAGAAPVRR